MFDRARFSRDELAILPTIERSARLRELETRINSTLVGAGTLGEFQERLYRVIEDQLVGQLGHWLGRWDYDSEVEYWGGRSYMDPTVPNELLLRSEFPFGVRLSWGAFEFQPWE
jgi:hypothetical protein